MSVIFVKIGDHCYHGLCDMGSSASAIAHSLYEEIMHDIAPAEIEDIDVVGERSRKQKFSDLRTSPGPLWRLHTWFDLFRYRLVAQREVESMTIGGADPRS